MKKFVIILSVVVVAMNSFAQKNYNAKYRLGSTFATTSQYNLLIGENQNLLQTTPKALGSGVYDFSGMYSVIGVWLYNPNKRNIGLGFSPVLKVSKFRFTNNYKIVNNTFSLDLDPEHTFYEGYFNRDGSKLVVKKIVLPLVIFFPISKWVNSNNKTVGLYITPFFETYAYGYHKLFYHDASGKLRKIKTDNAVIRQMITPNNYGIRIGMKIKHLYLYAQYTFLNFFKENTGLNVNELNAGIGINWLEWWLDSDDNNSPKSKATSL